MKNPHGKIHCGQLILGLLFTIFFSALILFIIPWQVPILMEGEALTPASFPRLTSVIALLLSVIFTLDGIRKCKQHKSEVDVKIETEFNMSLFRVGVAITSMFVYAVATEYLGYLITTFSFLIYFMLFMGARRWITITVSSLMITFFVYYFFSQIMKVPLPEGPLGF